MEKRILFVLALILGIGASGNAFALNCIESQGVGKSDSCYTAVRLAADETTLVSQGMILVYDVSEGTANGFAYQAELSDASADQNLVAGVAQGSIASGNQAFVAVRGQAKVRLKGAVASGESLYVSATEGKAGTVGSSGSRQIGFALQNGTDGQVIDAYLTIV
jgi:lipopolysaccharide export system protein LptA